MRQKRAKTYKRLMALYTQTFNFRSPFQILVSDDLLTMPSASQLDIHKALSSCVQAEIKPMITQCCMESLYSLGKDQQHLINLGKTFERRRCNHRTAVPSNECLKDVIGETNKHRYILACQSQSLRASLERIPGLPMIHFNATGVIVMAPASTATIREKNNKEEEKRLEGIKEVEGIVDGGNVLGGGGGTVVGGSSSLKVNGQGMLSKRGRVKGPNPLSVKKKKVVQPAKPVKKREREEEEDVEGNKNAGATKEAGDSDKNGNGQEEVRKKKKRKRRGKGDVAKAIEELNTTGGLDIGSPESSEG